MDLELEGKVAWVTGASAGLGRATAEALAREGATVAVSARRGDVLNEVAGSLGHGSRAYPIDVTDETTIYAAAETIADELGAIDILVANAGGPPLGTFETLQDDAFKSAFALTLESAWHLSKAATQTMIARGGVIVFITSVYVKEVTDSFLLSSTMRNAVTGLAKQMSKELGAHGIRVVCIAPGRIDTERSQSIDEAAAERSGRSAAEIRSAGESLVPLGRYGRPEEIGNVIAFLCSGAASYISGTTVVVDGGRLNTISS